MQCYTFPKWMRLSRKKEIDRVFSRGSIYGAGLIRVRYSSSALAYSRFLVSVSRKAGNSPQRNRIKRLIREAIRLYNPKLRSSYDICFFVTKAPQTALTFSSVEDKIVKIFAQLNRQTESPTDRGSRV